jgi:predicted MFS family arabinose efflux permease
VREGRRTEIALAAAAALALADASVVTLALPRLLTELDATVEGVAAVLVVYTVVLAVALLPAERLRRALGSRALGFTALALFAAGSLGCAVAPSLEALLVLRAVQALGAAGALVSAFNLLGAGLDGSSGRRLWTDAAVVGVAAGPALGGVLTQLFDWRAIFVVQVPVAAAGAFAALRTRPAAPARPEAPPEAPSRVALRGPLAALALVSAALTAVLFLLVLLLVAGWNLSPLAAALTVSVLPLAALAAGRTGGGDARSRAATGCVLVGAGTLALAFLPLASAWWTVIPQALAGAGMGLSLPALAGRLLPERNARDAAWLLMARHAGIALALVALAPVVSSNLDSATLRARERGVAVVLDSPLPPQDKITLAPDLLASVSTDRPRHTLAEDVDRNRSRFSGADRVEYDRLGQRVDDVLVQAVKEAFRTAFLISGALALLSGVLVLPPARRRAALARAAIIALTVPALYALLDASIGPEPVRIADPCKPRKSPSAEGIAGVLQDQALATLDQVACHFGSSREELVLALADKADAQRFKERYGVDPRSAGVLLQGLIGP